MNAPIQRPEPQGLVQLSSESSRSEGATFGPSLPQNRLIFAALLTGLVLLLFGVPSIRAQGIPPGCTGSAIGISLFTSAPDVHIGDTLTYSVSVFNGLPGNPTSCDASNIVASLTTPDGVVHPITLTRTYLSHAQSDFYPNVVSYVVRAQDIRPDGTVRATAEDTAIIYQNDTPSNGGANQGVNTEVSQPCIAIAVQCVGSVGENGAITFTGTVTNCGNNRLVLVSVTNFVNGGQSHVAFITNLFQGQVAQFSGSWIPLNPCSPSTATLVAYGSDSQTASPKVVTNTASTTCQNVLTPGIRVTKTCPAQPVAPGQLLTYSGSVSNTGNVTLTNIVVVNNQPVANTTVFTAASLAPGAVASFTGSYVAPTNCSVSDTLTANATSRCGVGVSSTASATCPILTTPQIAVTVVCPIIPAVSGGTLTYDGTVRNTGNTTLTGIVVVSDRPVPNTTVFTTASLAPGAAANFSSSLNVPVGACSVTTTFSGRGQDICTTSMVTNTVSPTCPITTAPAIVVTLTCPATPVATGGVITYTGTVRNSGNVTLNNVTVVNNQSVPSTVFTVASLVPGAVSNYTASFTAPVDACSVSSAATGSGSDNCTGTLVNNSAFATCTLVTAPGITVTQSCPANTVSLGGVLTYSGTVNNTGNITLTNVVVTNDRTGASPVFTIATLAPGASASFTGSYTVPLNAGCAISSTLTANGRNKCDGAQLTANATASCPLQGAANITVTLACPTTPTPLGGLLTFSGTVSNAGNVTLTNITVVRNQFEGNTSSGPYNFGTITPPLVPPVGTVTSRFVVGSNFNGLTYADQDEGYAATQFYSLRREASGGSTFVTINASGTVTGRFDAGNNNFDALTFAAPDVGYGPVIFYYLRHDSAGVSSFGTIKPGGVVGVVADLFVVGNNFDALTFAAPDVGYGPNLFYYLRHDINGSSTFGSINPALPGTVTDRFNVGNNFDALTFAAPDVGYGPNLFYYLRHDSNGRSTFGTITATGTVTDRFNVGTNINELTFTSTDVGFGANLFYYLGGGSNAAGTNTTPQPFFTLPSLAPGASANFTGSYTVPGSNACSINTSVSASANDQCAGSRIVTSALINCPLITTPSILVTQTCPANPVAPGGLIVYGGSVRNTGNITLTNITVVGSQPAPNTVVFTLALLAPGASASFSTSFNAPLDACAVTSTLTATGRDQCNGSTVNSSVTTTCPTVTAPQIRVTKTCPTAPVTEGGLLVFTGTVTNTGNITLTNIFIVNNRPIANTAVLGPITLAPGAGTSFSGSYTAPLDSCLITDTLTATGQSKCNGSTVTHAVSATCPIVTIPRIAVTLTCPLVPAGTGGLITYAGTVMNSGNVTLNNVTVINNQSVPSTVLSVASLAPGATANFTTSLTAPADACAVSTTVVASGSDACSAVRVSTTATTTCPLVTTPRIVVTQTCPATPAGPGGILTYSGTVSNAGNITLTNIVITNDRTGATTVFTVATLAPGATAGFNGSYTVPLNGGCSISSTLTGGGYDKCTGVRVTSSAPATCQLLTTPSITVTQTCPGTLVSPGGILTYSGTVSNSGNITLTNIIVVNNHPATNTVIFTVATLAPGATTNFTGSYQVPLNCCVVSSTLGATGRDICTGATVADTFTATCTVLTTARLVVTKVCPPTVTRSGEVLQYSGTVSNAGNITLINVTIVNDQPVAGSPVWGPLTLAPGESVSYYGSYVVLADLCGTDTVTASGLDVCTFLPVTSSVITTCPVITSPRIAVTKNCPQVPTPRGGLYTFTGSVSNAGNVTLINVYVVDNQPSNNTPVIGPISLAPGATTNFSGSYIAPACCCYLVDTITARGQDHCTGGTVAATASAICPLSSTPRITVTKVCPQSTVPVGGLFTYSGTVSNAGDVVLTNVFVVSSQPNANTPLLGPIELAPRETKTYNGSYTVTPNSNLTTDTVTASGTDTCGGRTVTAAATCAGPIGGLVIGSVTLANGVATVTWTATLNTVYTLQYKTNLQDSVWTDVPGNVVATGNSASKTDFVGSTQRRFYRVMVVLN